MTARQSWPLYVLFAGRNQPNRAPQSGLIVVAYCPSVARSGCRHLPGVGLAEIGVGRRLTGRDPWVRALGARGGSAGTDDVINICGQICLFSVSLYVLSVLSDSDTSLDLGIGYETVDKHTTVCTCMCGIDAILPWHGRGYLL